MRRQYALPLALLFIALGVSSNAQKGSKLEERRVTVEEGAPLTVECALRVEERVEWRLNGSSLPGELRAAGESPGGSGGRLSARLQTEAARAQHAGVYTCTRPPGQRVHVLVRAALSRPSPSATPSPAGETTPSPGQTSTATAEGSSDAVDHFYYDVGRPFFLNCSMPQYPRATTYLWKKNDTTLDQVPSLLKRFNLEEGGSVFRIVGKTTEEDYGNYTCLVEGVATRAFDVRGRPFAKLSHNLNVVEKQKLKILCKVIGKPYPAVSWTFNNTSDNRTDVREVFGERVELRRSEFGVEGGELVIEQAERTDAGQYTCTPLGANDTYSSSTTLRVKDKFAALWPFLGICAEVFVLCAIILVYEKRRTKPELDDSDTDNHDQKKS